MKKVLVALIALIGLNVTGMAQAATAPVKKAEDKMKAVPATPVKVVEMPKTLSKTPAAKPASAASTPPPVTLKKDGTPDKRFKTTVGPTKKDGTPDLRYKKNVKGKSK